MEGVQGEVADGDDAGAAAAKRRNVALEIFSTEKSYVDQLTSLSDHYYKPLVALPLYAFPPTL